MRKFKCLLIICILFSKVIGQNKNVQADATNYFDSKDYEKAYEIYDKLYTQFPKNFEYKFRLGYSSLYCPEKKVRAIEIFEYIKNTDKSPDADYYLAKAYHINYKFDEAIKYYDLFIASNQKKTSNDDLIFLEDAHLGIINCNNGKELISKKSVVDIKNIGSPINTHEIEGVPVISSDESIMIFTYIGTKSKGGLLNDMLKQDKEEGVYHEDIFISTRNNDSTWGQPSEISSLNTNGNDAAVALSPDGQVLFTFVSDANNPGDLYSSSLLEKVWSNPVKLNTNINSESWEGSCSITADGRYLYFASSRPGGMGGRDIYVSEMENGDWGPAKNLGPTINTKYNEDAPFIHPDGITLFFSSEGHKSIGGYDIMYSIKKENNWLEPLSMGIPLNTTEDDRYYVINAKGNVGYFSSNRGGTGGKGEQDIYTVTPGILIERLGLAILKGNVYVDDKPSEAKIELIKKENNEAIGPYYANPKTGKYLMAITPGNEYKIKISIKDEEPIEEEVYVENIHKFVEIKKDFYAYTTQFEKQKNQISVKTILNSLLQNNKSNEVLKNDTSISNSNIAAKTANSFKTETTTKTNNSIIPLNLNPCSDSVMPDFTTIKGKSLNDPTVYKQLLSLTETMCAEGLVFKVQIAAYKYPENYKYNHLKQFGVPEITTYPDGITRFTQLSFSTIKQAEEARQKIIAKGQKDAWLTAFINGKRYTLEELILVNFNTKAIN